MTKKSKSNMKSAQGATPATIVPEVKSCFCGLMIHAPAG